MTTTKLAQRKRRRIIPRGPNHRTSARQLECLQTMRLLVDSNAGAAPSIGQIAERLGRSKSAVHDMLVRMQRRGLVEHSGDPGNLARWRPADGAAIVEALAAEDAEHP